MGHAKSPASAQVRRVVWTDEAVANLESIAAYISDFNPLAAQRLPNGNTLFGNCHAGPDNPQFIEVTKDKKVVWTFKDFKNFGNSMPVQTVLGAK